MVNTGKRTVFNILVLFYIFSRGVAVAHEVLILIGWVRVLAGEIPRSVAGKHKTCVVLGVGSNPTVRNYICAGSQCR